MKFELVGDLFINNDIYICFESFFNWLFDKFLFFKRISLGFLGFFLVIWIYFFVVFILYINFYYVCLYYVYILIYLMDSMFFIYLILVFNIIFIL